MYIEVFYSGNLLSNCPIARLTADFLESLFVEYDEDYDLSSAYEEISEWVEELELKPLYV